MATLESVATKTLAQLGMDANLTLATSWARDRYTDLLSNCKLNQARKLGTLTVPANITAGTVSVTQNTTVVTGDATAAAAWPADISVNEGWFIRLGTPWYRVVGRTALTLILETAFTESTVTDGTYVLKAREFVLPKAVKRLGLFSHQRYSHTMYPQPLHAVILADPARTIVDGGPQTVVDLGAGLDGRKTIEVYPGSSTAETLDYIYWQTADHLANRDPLPITLDASQLEEGVKINAYEWLGNRAASAGQMEAAQVYFNLRDRQRAVWQAVKRDLIRQDGAMDDITFVAQRARPSDTRDIRTAEDYVWAKPLT